VIDTARDLLDNYWVLMPVKVLAVLAIFLTFPLVVGYMEHKVMAHMQARVGAASGHPYPDGVEVNDIQAVVAELRRRDVMFEEVDVPGLRTVDGIAEVEGNYPSTGVGERAAWFGDSEGNLLGIGQAVRER